MTSALERDEEVGGGEETLKVRIDRSSVGANKGSLNFQLQSFLTLLQSYPKLDSTSSGGLAEGNV